MRDGQNLAGVVREESDLSLTLVQGNGKPVEVRKADITGRVRSAVSLMPGTFPHLLDPAQVAAITAWLLEQKAGRNPQASATAPVAAPITAPTAAASTLRIDIVADGDALRVTADGQPFTRFVHAGLRAPVLFPLISPSGVNVTRNYPLAPSEGDERQDHPHHTALWFSHGAVDGLDFWRRGTGATFHRIVPSAPPRIVPGASPAIAVDHDWIAADGRVVCRDRRFISFTADAQVRTVDYQITLLAPADRAVVFGDTEEGTMAIRTHQALALTGQGALGSALNSTGVRGKDVWGKRAAWVDYWAPIAGETVGVAIFDHPQNPRHPTWWHARDYGLITANPFGIHDYEGKPPGTGDLRIEAGQQVTLRYRFVIHRGDAATAGIAQRYAAFASP